MVSSEQGGRAVGGEFREEMKRETANVGKWSHTGNRKDAGILSE